MTPGTPRRRPPLTCRRGSLDLAGRPVAWEEIQIINLDGIVMAVAEITGISKHEDRQAIQGRLLRGDPRVGQPTTTPHPSRNSVHYP